MSDSIRYVLFRAVFFAVYAPIGVMFPFFVLYLDQQVGLTDKQISYITGIGGITVVLFQQLWGYAGDCLVSKKRLVVFNLIGAGALFLVMGQLRSFWTLAVVAFVFQTLYSSVNQLLHGFLFVHRAGESWFGILRAYASLGFVVANIGVGFAADRFAGGRLDLIFPVFCATCLASAFLLWPIPDPKPPSRSRPPFLAVQSHFLGCREVRLFLLMAFVYQGAHSLSYTMQAILLSDMGAERSTIAFCYSLAALLELPVFFAASRLRMRFGDVNLLLFAALVQAVRWLAVWQADSPNMIILSSMSHCITFGLFYAAGVGYMNDHAGAHFKASGQTMMAFVYMGLASVFGNYVGGQVVEGGLLQPLLHRIAVDMLHLPDQGMLQNLYVFCSLLAVCAFLIGLRLRHVAKIRVGRCGEALAPAG